MSPDRSRSVDTLDPHSLESFTSELIADGFEPLGDETEWVGPIDAALRGLTTAYEMRIKIRDGWPFRRPTLHVRGLDAQLHVNSDGEVCLWDEGDSSYGWCTLSGFRDRIAEWGRRAQDGSARADGGLDAHLYFERRSNQMATIDLDDLQQGRHVDLRPGRRGELRAESIGGVTEIGRHGDIPVRWYFCENVDVPPADKARMLKVMPSGSATNLERALGRLQKGRMVVLLLWRAPQEINALAVLVSGGNAKPPRYEAMEIARVDRRILQLRAGPDTTVLGAKKVIVFGVGAIGSHVAVALAVSGVGSLVLIDGEKLRPADVVRHAAGRAAVGMAKPAAVEATIRANAPWASVQIIDEAIWAPERMETIVEGADVVVDATGSQAHIDALSAVTSRMGSGPGLISVALYRRGQIARVSVQLTGGVPIYERTLAKGFVVVPRRADESENIGWETGCGAPIINAPPAAVVSAGAAAVRATLDVLLDRGAVDEEIHETYERGGPAPFNELGRQSQLA